MTFGVLAVLGAVSIPACGGTLEDDYQRQERAPVPGSPTTGPEDVSAPAGHGDPGTISV